MSSTEASSVFSVIPMQLKFRWVGVGAEVCALAKNCHILWFICKCGPKTSSQVACPSAGGGKGLIRNPLGRAEAQPSNELNATTKVGMGHIQEAT